MKYMVTGGAGFIGSHIAEELTKKGEEVVVLDNLRSGFRENVEPFGVEFINCNVTDATELVKHMKGVDVVFHLAALISVPESMEKPHLCIEINAVGTLNVLEAARKCGVKKVVLSSSAANYGDNPTLPKREDMYPEPKSPYAVTKLDGEYYLKMYRDAYDLATVSLRYFNVFGPRQDPKSQYAAAVPIFIFKALRNEDITIFGDGEQTRDFVYVKDVAAANILVGHEDKATDVYNVARGGKITINELAEKIIRITGSKSKIKHAEERLGDIKHSTADISRITSVGFKAGADLDEGLTATIEFFKRKS